MRALHVLALCAALLALSATAQRPKLKYGLTLATCGVSASIAVLQRQTLLWYANFTNAHGGVNVSGVIHDIEFIMYNDAFDNQLMEILYERLVTEDKVDLLMGPLGAGSAGFAVAQKYKRVVMNSGDFTYYSAFNAPNGTFGGWLFSAVPNAVFLADQCFAQIASAGATRISSAWPENVRTNSFDLINILAAGRNGVVLAGKAPLILDDLSNLDDVIATMKSQKADVFSGTLLSPDASYTVVDRMIRAGYQPKAFMVWIGPNYRSFRDAAPWQSAGMLFPGAWDPSLNYTDRLFGSSQRFFDEFLAGVGREPDVTDVVAVFAAESLRLAVEIAGTTDSDALRAALLSMNEQTFFGIANFTADALQQTNAGYYCFQVAENGQDIYPISANAPQAKQMRYPVKLNYPSGYVSSKSQRSKWLGVGLGVGLGALFLVALILAAYFIVVKYQIVFIPKSEDKGEW